MNFPSPHHPVKSVHAMRFCCALEERPEDLLAFSEAAFEAYLGTRAISMIPKCWKRSPMPAGWRRGAAGGCGQRCGQGAAASEHGRGDRARSLWFADDLRRWRVHVFRE
jgi:hypothetical protein